MWPLWLLPMLLGVKPWEARLRQSTAQWRKGGKRELLPGTLLAFSVAKDTQRKHKLVDTAWMQSYAGVARQHGHSNINAVASRIEKSKGRVIAIARVSAVHHLSRRECAALPSEMCAQLGVWNDRRIQQWRETEWAKKPEYTLCLIVFDRVMELQAGKGPEMKPDSVIGNLQNTPCFLRRHEVKRLRKCITIRSAGTQEVCLVT